MSACRVNIDSNEYYIDCDRVNDLAYIDGYLVNTSSSSLTLKDHYGDGTTYPYISCSSMSVCYLRSSQGASSQAVPSDYTYVGDPFYRLDFNHVVLFLLFVIAGIKLLWKR